MIFNSKTQKMITKLYSTQITQIKQITFKDKKKILFYFEFFSAFILNSFIEFVPVGCPYSSI